MTEAVRRQYGTLDGMRGIAAIAVVILHIPSLMRPISAPSAGLAVDLFFIMSGFIIAYAYEDKLASDLASWRFMLLRLIRLYPLYLLGVALGVSKVLAEIQLDTTEYWSFTDLSSASIAALIMLPFFDGTEGGATAPIFPLNPPSWSLFFEVAVNFAYAALFPLMRTRVLAVIVAVAGFALIILGAHYGNLDFGSHWHNFAGGIARVMYSFGVGILIYRFAQNGVPTLRIHPVIVLVACAGIFFAAPGIYTGVFQVICVLIILPMLVVLGVSTEPAGRLRSTFSFLGLISYGVYSLHYPLAMALKGVIQQLIGSGITHLAPWIGLTFIAGLVVFCWLIDRIYDAPARKFARYLLSKQLDVRARTPLAPAQALADPGSEGSER